MDKGFNSQQVASHVASFPDTNYEQKVQQLLEDAKKEGESYAGQLEVWIRGVPSSLGQPVFMKLKSQFASALMGIGATCSFEVGEGKKSLEKRGTHLHHQEKAPYGGIRGGISTGETIELALTLKPPSSIGDISKKGRHDPCILPRVVPVVENMLYACLLDQILMARLDNI